MRDLPEQTDSTLMERTAGGDREAFSSLICRHQGLVLSIAFRFLGDRARAEDACQEVFLRLWHSARRYRPDASLEAYLRRLTVNFCLDLRRRARFRVISQEEEQPSRQDPHADLEASELRRALERAMQTLPPSQRLAVILFHIEGLSVSEVSELLSVSSKAVESLLSRARATLRGRLAPLLKAP